METTEPVSVRGDETDESEAGQVAPPVVAIVVATDPDGEYLPETLAALAAQDYAALSVLVLVDPAARDPKPRIAAAHPRAFVRPLRNGAASAGFAAAANDALAAVEGAPFLLFCHDDVAPDPDAVRLLVEEAYRSNAGIVGPKLVDAHRPEVLLEVGMAIDHYGVPFSGIEPREVDQEQHDAVRDVFFVSHALMLVRADLLHELGGFDTAAVPGADDVDLCWRARLAGARVVVAPAARVGHRRTSVAESRARRRRVESSDDRGETRARVRVLCKAYSAVALLWVVPCALFLSVAEAVGLLFTARPRRAGAVLAGWFAAFAHPGELRRARRSTQALRTVEDSDVRDLMIHGSARARTIVTERLHASDRIVDVSARTRERVSEASRHVQRVPIVVGTVLAVLVLFGSRALLLGRVPEVVGFRAWPGIGTAWSTLSGPWRTTFMGGGVAATPAFGLMAALETVLLGHGGLARSLVVGGALPLGAWGAYRLVRTLRVSTLAGVGAAVAYAANPIARNAVWQGELGPLVCFALAPFVFGALVRAASNERSSGRGHLHSLLTIALLVAVVTAVWPPGVLLALFFAIAFLVAVPFTRDALFATRAVARAAIATAIAVVLCSPWLWSLIGADAATLGLQPRAPLALGDLLSFHTSRAGAGIAPWGILAAAVVPLAIASGDRIAWAMRAWTLAVLSFALAWLPPRLSPGAAVPAPDAVLVGAALGLAVAAGIGVAAIFDDLRGWHFGWRQVIPVVAGAGLLLAMLGLAADTPSGRWGLGGGDWAQTYSWMSDGAPPGGFRVLWLGDPNLLPADAKVVHDTGYALTRNGAGDARALWAAPTQPADDALADAIASAEAGHTSRLGHLLAPAGVRYVAFLRRGAPGDGATGTPNPVLEDALSRQLDLELSRVDSSGVVYQNNAWIPSHALVPPGAKGVHADATDPMAASMRTEADGVQGVGGSSDRTEPTGPGTLLWSEAANTRWHASSNGRTAPRTDAFGWTNAFALEKRAPVSVHYDAGALPGLLHVLEVAAWLLAAFVWVVTRRRTREAA